MARKTDPPQSSPDPLDPEDSLAVRQSNERYRVFFENVRDPVLVFPILDNGERGPFLDVNRAACEFYGYTREEMLALSVKDIDAPEFLPTVPPAKVRFSLNSTAVFEALHVNRRGARIPCEVTAHMFTLDGRSTVISVVRTMAERKQAQTELERAYAEMERRVRQRTRDLEHNYRELKKANKRLMEEMSERAQAEERLRVSEQRYRFLVDNLQEGIWRGDRDNNTMFINKRLADILGYTPEAITGRPIFEFMDAESSAICRQKLARRRMGISETYELRFVGKNTIPFPVRISATPVLDDSGDYQGSLAAITDISDLRQARDTLAQSETRLRSIIQGTPMGMHLYRLDDKNRLILIDANPAADRITGIDTSSRIGLPMDQAFPGTIGSGLNKRYIQTATLGTPWRFQDLEYDDGDIRGVFDSHVFQTSPGHVAVLFEDVTDRRNAETARQTSLNTMRAVLDSIPSRISVVDYSTHEILFANKAIRDCHGEDILGQKCWKIFNGNNGPCHDCRWDAILANGSQTWTRARDGRDHLNLSRALEWIDGRRVKLQVSTDISELATARRAADEAEGRYRKLLHDTVVGVFRASAQGRFVNANPALARLLGYESAEDLMASVPDSRDLYVDPEIRKEILATAACSAKDLSQFEVQLRRRDGGVIWVREFVRTTPDASGRPEYLEGFLVDVTPQKTLENRLRQEKDRAESANRAKSAFLANMSHEIRTPLNGVLGMLQLMRLAGTKEERDAYIETAITSGRNLLALISDILDLSRVEAGRMEIECRRFQLKEILNNISDTFSKNAEAKGIRLSVTAGADVPDILAGDAGRLRQVLFNLVGNGIKFTDKGSVAVRVSRTGKETDKIRLLFTVEDTGVGIPEHMQNEIFKPFSQADESFTRRFQGAGLGLSIVRRLVELMGGSISLESAPEAGTAFHCHIPFDLPESEPPIIRRKSVQGPAQNSSLRVLLAEDDRVNQIAAGHFLERIGHTVTLVSNGREALDRLAGEPFDILLLDVQMPEMDGLETARIIRANPSGDLPADIPILAVTAHAMAGDRERFLKAGMDGYVAKPIDMEEVGELLSRLTAPKDADDPE